MEKRRLMLLSLFIAAHCNILKIHKISTTAHFFQSYGNYAAVEILEPELI